MNVYKGFIQNGLKVETTQIFFSLGKQLSKLWYIHTMDYYLVIKRYELSIPITTWMNLQRMILSAKNGNPNTAYSV